MSGLPELLFHPLSAPWLDTKRWMRILYHIKGARTPVSHIAAALTMHKNDICHVMEVEKIRRVPYQGYVERGILLTDIPRLLRSPLLKLNWSADQIRQAVSYFDKKLGREQDGGASPHYTASMGHYGVKPRFIRDDGEDDNYEEEEEVASASLEALATEAALQTSLKRSAPSADDDLEEWVVAVPKYPKEWEALLCEQRASVHNLAMAAFRGHPDYEEMKKTKLQELEAGLYEELRPAEVRAMTSNAKREAVAEIMRERSAEISAQRAETTNGALFSFHLPPGK
jgi:hypothetical protein